MSPRARRLLAVGSIAVLLLLAGRLAAETLTAVWWADALSPAAGEITRRWVRLGLLLDLIAIGVASGWFALQAVLVARAIGVVQVERQVDGARIREPIPRRTIFAVAILAGLLLGWLTGNGARAWRAPVALWWSGVEWGATDAVLGEDFGTLVGDYPVWQLLHGFALLLVLLGGAFATILYIGIGAFSRRDGELEVHLDARRHLGALATLAALLIGVGFLLVPYQLAVSPEPPLAPMAGQVRGIASQAMAGAALAVAGMSLAWTLRARHSLLVSAWLVMLLGVLAERLVIPAFLGDSGVVATRDAEGRRHDALAWGLQLVTPLASTDTVPSLTEVWDADALEAWGRGRGGHVWSVVPVAAIDSAPAGWMVAMTAPSDSGRAELYHVRSDALRAGGRPLAWPAADLTAASAPRTTLADARIRPDAAAWRHVPGMGVVAGGALRRTMLAWGRQAPGMLGLSASEVLDWQLAPLARLEALLPMYAWTGATLQVVAGRPTWVSSGLRVLSAFPLSSRGRWGRDEVAGVAPAVVGTIDAETGAVRVFADPSGDPVAAAWARWLAPLVEPTERMPDDLRQALPYPTALFAAQVGVLGRGSWGVGRPSARASADGPPAPAAIVRVGTAPAWQVAMEDPARRVLSGVVRGRRRDGRAIIEVDTIARAIPENPREVEREWLRSPLIAQLRDSARAVGDSIVAGPIRWHECGGALAAWMPLRTLGTGRGGGIVWIATARGTAVAGGRTPAQAWSGVVTPAGAPGMPSGDLPARVEAARAWLRRADSALARGDLTAFGRAWEALRGLLDAGPSQ